MTGKSGILGLAGVQAEDSFAGDGTGPIIRVSGVRELEPSWQRVQQQAKVNVWRHPNRVESFGGYVRGRMDMELHAGAALDLLARTMFREHSAVADSGQTLKTYRMPRVDEEELESVRLLVELENGPWVELRGLAVTQFRITSRAFMVSHVSLDWLAAAMVEIGSDPGWNTISEPVSPCGRGADTIIEVDGLETPTGIEASVSFRHERALARTSRAGIATGWRRTGTGMVQGSLIEYSGDVSNLPAKVRSGDEFALRVSVANGAEDMVSTDLPRVVAMTGQPQLLRQDDVTQSIGWRAIHDDDPSNDPMLAILVHDLI
jgi:hypothetical protein